MRPHEQRLHQLAERQYGAVSRAQVLAMGGDDAWIMTRLRSGHWLRRLPGVYLTFTGPVPWASGAIAALLWSGTGAALSHRSAAYRHGMLDRAPQVLDVSIPHTRKRSAGPGIRVHRRRTMPAAQGRLRTVVPAAAFADVVEGLTDVDSIVGLTARALRAASLGQLRIELARRSRLPNRTVLDEILGAVERGVESPLEYRYHRDVERGHGLPRSVLQQRQVLDGLWLRADCVYPGLGLRVELDGQVAHPGGRTDADVWRDNAALVVAKEVTLRYRWVHVASRPCETARQVGQALRAGGWAGVPTPCGPGCAVLR